MSRDLRYREPRAALCLMLRCDLDPNHLVLDRATLLEVMATLLDLVEATEKVLVLVPVVKVEAVSPDEVMVLPMTYEHARELIRVQGAREPEPVH